MTNPQQVLEEIRALLVKLSLGPADVDPATRLVDDLDFDSLDWLDLAVALEEHFNVTLRDEKLAKVQTIADVVDRAVAALAEESP